MSRPDFIYLDKDDRALLRKDAVTFRKDVSALQKEFGDDVEAIALYLWRSIPLKDRVLFAGSEHILLMTIEKTVANVLAGQPLDFHCQPSQRSSARRAIRS